MTEPTRSVLVTDLDNTLWDWFSAWHAAFSAMLDVLVEQSGVPRDVLLDEIRPIHQRHGTSEYSWLLDEVPSLQVAAGGRPPLTVFDDAMHALHSARRRSTHLYPTVEQTLRDLKERGVLIVGYTESVAYWTEWRIKHTGLDGCLDVLYSAPDHDAPSNVPIQAHRRREPDAYGLKQTIHRHVERGVLKPNADVLRQIVEESGHTVGQAVYVGDSLIKDVAMAQGAGVFDAHAKYGDPQQIPGYDLIQRVSHWPEVTVAHERTTTSEDVRPSLVLESRFAEILTMFERE